MDRSQPAVVSGRIVGGGTSAAVRRSPLCRAPIHRSAAAAFTALRTDNPLLRLGSEDREFLWAILTTASIPKDAYDANRDPVELAHRAAVDARKLADQLECDLFRGPLQDSLQAFIAKFRDLPAALRELACVSHTISVVGKLGQKGKAGLNQLLVMASELVRLRTGHYYDEHLMELWQGIRDPNLTKEELTADTIRKTRSRLQNDYPDLYRAAVARVEEWSSE